MSGPPARSRRVVVRSPVDWGGRAVAAEHQAPISEAQIAVHWREEQYYYPPAKFIAQANAADPAIFDRFSEEHFPECFKEYADLLSWDTYWHTTLDTSNPPFWKWFVGGQLNASYNCVDRHLATSRNKAALIWVPEPESEETKAITYQELYTRVNEFAALVQPHAQRVAVPGVAGDLRQIGRGDPLPPRREPLRGLRGRIGDQHPARGHQVGDRAHAEHPPRPCRTSALSSQCSAHCPQKCAGTPAVASTTPRAVAPHSQRANGGTIVVPFTTQPRPQTIVLRHPFE